ncbi:MAG: PfaD family polyunsaturated fatty acid/polyketide biosynthesis protein [Desulfobacterales bacterium]|jgi:PfaD family protein|nr:PfaD family polyunsaturated fatty acid/polyketide biosynthesis protein [Desulfobacterales bacterium]
MTHIDPSTTIGCWHSQESSIEPFEASIQGALLNVTRPIYVIEHPQGLAISQSGTAELCAGSRAAGSGMALRAFVPPLHPRGLGDITFKTRHGLRYAYVAGEMANGITSVRMVREAGRAGMVGFFGAGGLMVSEVEAAIDRLQRETPGIPFGVNLIHSPGNPELEMALADLFLRRDVRLISASAYVEPSLPLVYFRAKGTHRSSEGRIVCPNQIIAKVSRVEVARRFLAPPAEKHLARLLELGLISSEEAALAAAVPLAAELTAEADSGGHTDNRPAITLLPTMLALRDELSAVYGYDRPPCVGLAGGIATPESTAAAFALGAAYVLTGSVNQCCVEAGTSEAVCVMLAEAGQADVAMAPAADMFELGVKVQVLKRGTMFPYRAAKLYELYTTHARYDQIPAKQREMLERDFFRCSFEQEWEQTRRFFMQRDPKQVERAGNDPKHKMALVFRSYLGRSSAWAIQGEPTRKIDYQIWCGPAIGAFNQWARGSFLEAPQNRRTVAVAMNLLFGAAVLTRANWLRAQGLAIPGSAGSVRPMALAEIYERIDAAS